MVNFKETIADKLGDQDIADDSEVVFRYEERVDVHHYRDDYVDDALAQTGFAYTLTSAITSGPFYKNGNWILDEMRNEDLLEGYQRGEGDFEEYIATTITDNLYDYEWIERETVRHDYKRGELLLSYELTAPFSQVKNELAWHYGTYDVTVNTASGLQVRLP
jgi:hypothetical protein